ncbi:protein Dok-7 [Trichomycterus rosablanca]|uniref:protein Dok-7 n=1 Tax=Trichomycterus rosablanca TaxID=2290929 RepID=UPI002F35EB3A
MTDTVVVEGQVRLREGKKWKNRWVVLRKPSPVADCLCVLVYKERSDRSKGHRERGQLTLGDICGLELLQGYEGVNYTLTLLCLTQSVTFGFESRENLLAWDTRISYSLGEVHRFGVNVQPGTKLESGPASLHLCNNLLVLSRDVPPTVIGHWRLSDLRRYGAVPNGFIFEGGTRSGYWTGVFFLACTEGEQISFLFDCIARGVSPNRTPFGLRPSLPDLGARPSSAEERITQEASELEKRLSMLSVCSRHSSTASRSSSTPSLTGDGRSISSSSSETSHSDTSLSSHLAPWASPVRFSIPSQSPVLSGTRASGSSSGEHPGVVIHPPSKPPHLRGLQEAGRQNSTDSGIATGSHSSSSGSFSSYTGSIDTPQGAMEDFGSAMSLTLSPNAQTNTNPNASIRLPPQSQYVTASSLPTSSSFVPPGPLVPPGSRLCTCPKTEAPEGQESVYQVPAQLMQHYDSPRRILQSSTSGPPETAGVGPPDAPDSSTDPVPVRFSAGGEGVGLNVPGNAACVVCGGFTVEETSRNELMNSHAQHKWFWDAERCSSPAPSSPRSSLRIFRHSSSSGRLIAGESGSTTTERLQGESGNSVNYVNIPVSPVSKRLLNYMELDLQDVQESGPTLRGASSTKYAHIDIAVTEAAQRVGAQHAQGREERLHQLEQRRRGTPN